MKVLPKLLAIASLLCTATKAQSEDMLIGEYRAAKDAPSTKQWISGAGETLEIVNYRLVRAGRQPLYCPPEKMRLKTENYAQILDQQLLRQGNQETLSLMSVVDVLLDGLIRVFPCKK